MPCHIPYRGTRPRGRGPKAQRTCGRPTRPPENHAHALSARGSSIVARRGAMFRRCQCNTESRRRRVIGSNGRRLNSRQQRTLGRNRNPKCVLGDFLAGEPSPRADSRRRCGYPRPDQSDGQRDPTGNQKRGPASQTDRSQSKAVVRGRNPAQAANRHQSVGPATSHCAGTLREDHSGAAAGAVGALTQSHQRRNDHSPSDRLAVRQYSPADWSRRQRLPIPKPKRDQRARPRPDR